MNILALTSVYPHIDEMNSTPTVEYFCEEWRKQGHNIIVVHNSSRFIKALYYIPQFICNYAETKLHHPMPVKSTIEPLYRESNGIQIYRVPLLKLIPYGKFTRKAINKQIEIIDEILEENDFIPDIIIGHWINPQIELLPILSQKYNAQTSIVFHNDCTQKNIKRFDLRNSINNIDAVGCRNKTYAKYVKTELGLKKLPFICYSGVPDNVVENNSYGNHIKDRYIYIGRLIGYKNVDTIIKALSIAYKTADFHLDIIGDGYDKKKLIELVQELNVSENVTFYGRLDRNAVFEHLSNDDVFIMVSDNETFGMVYVEAMLMGCITVGSINGGIDGVIVDGKNGFLCKQGDEVNLVNIINGIRNMSDEEKKLIRNSAIQTANMYSDAKVAERYLNDIMTW